MCRNICIDLAAATAVAADDDGPPNRSFAGNIIKSGVRIHDGHRFYRTIRQPAKYRNDTKTVIMRNLWRGCGQERADHIGTARCLRGLEEI